MNDVKRFSFQNRMLTRLLSSWFVLLRTYLQESRAPSRFRTALGSVGGSGRMTMGWASARARQNHSSPRLRVALLYSGVTQELSYSEN